MKIRIFRAVCASQKNNVDQKYLIRKATASTAQC